ncbi:hypothetical protein A9236_01960 [Polynucleobacter sp. QLW-P1DATA-2]|uniref:filamentous hemagglutinin N-terminal domain-containing protein n=1 Tax=Polynucleobacter sp. QLW-P1DATA-2 TaxID=1743167 RepID=UPI00091E6451|nr:filamentous hemagglutinin N-terminal domain-containing protein [Polynucleobacter sp. QLW-P1DATA-2]OIN03681.1 hypothetical protein A9236_01960 [Polynucleobacter sp. QLW-P1DATA-2]
MSNTSRNLGISFWLSKKHAHHHDGHGVRVRKTMMASVALSATLFVIPSAFAGPAANALPTNGQVAAGQASISQAGNVMNINQSTQRAVINWDSFNVGKNATVNFNQPNANSSTLNRVNGASKSMIDGAVRSNGQVIFVNPNGVVFGKGAEVNTGGLVATTMDIKDSDYMSGKMHFSGGESGKVINKGTITANGINGYIALMAPEVKNQGVLIANISNSNTIALVSGTKVTLSFNGSQLTDISVDASAINSLISNKHAIIANGGQIIIAANAASNLKASVINNTGTINSDSITTSGGKVFLTAGTVNQNGTVSANSETQNAGQVVISGNQIKLNESSKTTATGATSGGQILIGKTSANTAQSQVNADVVTVAKGAIVDASATQNGNGGSISIWSQVQTTVAGTLKAMGGAISGNGGNIDTSSAKTVTYGSSLMVDTTAPHGKTGNWITDPLAIIIDSNAATVLSNALSTTNVTLDATAATCGVGACTQSGTPVITFLADVYSANPLTSLYLNAQGGSINLDSNVTAGSVYAVAQTINIIGSLNTNGGSNSSIYLAGAMINILGNINSNGNSNNNTNSGNLNSANTATANNRRNSMNGQNGQNGLTSDSTIYASNGGSINIIASGDINIGSNTNSTSYISANGQNGGSINIISVNGNINNYGIVDAVGKNNLGGAITLAAQNANTFNGALIAADGYTQGGIIQIGVANSIGSGSTLAPPSINSQVATLLAAVNFTPSSNILSNNTSLNNATVITANAVSSNSSSTPQVVLNSQAGQIYIAGNNSLNTAATIQSNADNGGLIILSSPAGTYQNSGYIQTNGGAGLGGTIAQSGLISTSLIGATLESNGQQGGGNIVTGRDFQASPLPGSAAQDALLPSLSSVITVPTSQLTTVDANSILSANAISSGNGGNVLVWGDSNSIAGTLSAKAMGATGNGGFIETSGEILNVANTANISSASIGGSAGTWLLDPYDFYIAPSGGNITGAALTTALASNSVTITAPNTCANATCTATSSGTKGSIYVNDNVMWSVNTLALKSGFDIYIGTSSTQGSLTVTGSGSLTLTPSDSTISGYTSGGKILMGLASTPTGGLTTGYLVGGSLFSSGAILNSGAATGFNGQINASTSGVIAISGNAYTVINTEAAFTQITTGSTTALYILGSNLSFATSYTQAVVAAGNSAYFSGTLNGFGHQISNLAITNSTASSNTGLFGNTYGSISNLGVNGNITTTSANTNSHTGGLFGTNGGNGGTFANIYSTVDINASNANNYYVGGLIGYVKNATITNAYATGAVTAINGVGGLIGADNYGTLSYAGASGAVTSTGTAVGNSSTGGLVGYVNQTTISYSYATGAVNANGAGGSSVGGLIGKLDGSGGGSLTYAYATGNVTNATSGNTGGLVGDSSNWSTISNAYATGNVQAATNGGYVGGLIAYYTNVFGGTVSNSYASNTVTGPAVLGSSFATGGIIGWSGNGPNTTTPTNGQTYTNLYWDSSKNTITAGVGAITKSSGNTTFGTGGNGNGVSAISTTNLGTASNVTGFTFSSSVWGYNGSIRSTPILCSIQSCTSYTTSIVTDTFNGVTGAFSSNSGWSLGFAPTAENISAYAITSAAIGSGAVSFDIDSISSYALPISISSGASLSFINSGASSNSSAISSLISGAGSVNTASGFAGAVTLSGANTYTGGTTVSGGTLKAGSATALGGSAGAVTVAAGAALDLNGQTLTNTNALTLNGTGIFSAGALTNSSGTAGTYAGLITLGSASSINASSGNIVISNVGTITGAAYGLTLTGTNTASSIASIIGTSSGALTKLAAGTWTLSGANTFTGGTTISAGTLKAASATALGAGAVSIGSSGTLDLTYAGTVALGSTLSMSTGAAITNSANTSSLSVAGTSTLSGNINTAGNQTYTGAVTLGANTTLTTLNTSSANTNGTITFGSSVDSAAGSYYGLFTSNGTGTTAFGGIVGANSATSALGYLCINSSGCSASAVGTSTGNGTTALAGNVTTSGNQTYGGNLTLGADTALTSTNNGNVTIAGNITAPATSSNYQDVLILFNGSYTGSGIYSGSCSGTASLGCYALSTNAAASYTVGSVSSAISIAGGSLSYSSSTFHWIPASTQNYQVLLVAGGGGSGETLGGGTGGGGGAGAVGIGSLQLVASTNFSIAVGAGGVGGDNVGSSSTAGSNGSSSSIAGGLVSETAYGGGGGGVASSQCCGSISGSNGGSGGGQGTNSGGSYSAGSATKGLGTLTYMGNAGSLAVSNNNTAPGTGGGASSAGQSGNVSTSGGAGYTSVITGSTAIYGVGGGVAGQTLLANSGNGGSSPPNTAHYGAGNGAAGIAVFGYGGVLTITAPTLTINSGSGKASIGGSVSNVTTLTVNSTAANSVVSGAISGSTAVAYNTATGYTGSNGAAGILNLAGINTYTGGTTVSGGTLQAGSVTAFGGAASVITVNSGTALDLNGKTLANANTLNLNGTGISNGGALTNSSITGGTYAGAITLGSDSLIGSTSGAITVTGAIASGGSAYNLALVGNQAITLSSATNTLSTIASASSLGALSISNNQALTIGSMTIGGTTYSGLSSTGTILVKAITGNLAVNNAITTTSTSSNTSTPAIKLAAGFNDATSSTTNNIILGSSSSSLITAGSGAIIALYSGSPVSSSNLSAFVAAQTSDYLNYGVTTSNLPSSGAGYYAMYRGTQPNLYVIFGSSDTPTYGSAPTITYTLNTLANGTGTSYLSSDYSTINVSGAALFKGNNTTTSAMNVSLNSSANAGTYSNVFYLSGLSSPVYAISAGTTAGTLTINQIQAYVIITPSQSSIYGATPTVNYTFNSNSAGTGSVISASPTGLSGTASITNAPTSSSNAGTYNLTYAGGLSSTNYAFNAAASSVPYTVNQAQAYVIVTPSQTSIYGSTPTINYTFNTNSAGTGSVISASPTGLSGTASITNAPTSSSNAGTYNLTYASGLSSTNYAFNPAASSVPYTVNQAPLSIAISKAYNGSTGFTSANTYSLSGTTYNGDSLPSIASGAASVSSPNATTYTGFASNGLTLSNANYTLTGGTVSATISPKTITYTTSDATSVYGTLATLSTPVFVGLVGSDNPGASVSLYSGTTPVSLSTTTNAGTYAQQVAITNGNYQIASTGNGIGNLVISPATLAITGANNTPTYNGSTQTNTGVTVSLNGGAASAISGTTVSTGIGAQTFTLSGLASGLNASTTAIADNLSITPNAASGAISSNYSISYTNGSLTIGKANLSVTGTQVYNGTATIAGSSLTISGVAGQTFTGSGTADLTTKNVQSNQQLASVNGLVLTPNGSFLVSNYNTINVANTSVSITPLAITLSAPSITKVYDGGYTYNMTAANLATMSSQLAGGDTVSAASVVFTGNNPNVGTNKSVSLNSATISDGNGGSNYAVTLANSSTSQVTPAALTITANNASKFVTQSDTVGFNGVAYSGFVNGETASSALSGTLTVTRSNASTNGAGSYTGVLTPGGVAANNGNYTITPVAGNFTIVAANQLLVQVTPVTTTYGTAPTYTATAQYLSCSVSGCPSSGSVNTIHTLSPVIIGNAFSVNDGAGGTAGFTISPTGATSSGSGNTNVGSYQLSNGAMTGSSTNFSNTLVLTGALTVTPLTLAANQLGVSGISKVYNGSTAISGLSLNTTAASSSIKTGDAVVIAGTGTYADANVGTSKSVTVSVGLTGNDAGNYVLSSNQITANIGTITQLASVTYTGTSGGNWSNASNWAGGAIPTLGNVATVVIPTATTVVYDAANLSALTPTSAITDNGTLSFTSGLPTTFANNVSGTGSIAQSGAGALTLTGSNSYSGGTTLAAGSSLIAGSSSALGTGVLNSSGGTFSTSGVTLPNLTVNGAVVLASNIASSGNQAYNGAVTINNSVNSTTLSSSAGNITFASTLNAGATNQSLVLSAAAGQVTFNGQVGVATQTYNTGIQSYSPTTYASYQSQSSNNLANLTVSANTINLNADITTRLTQIYNGSLLVGDNGSNGPTRVLLSEDPAIIFNGTINDTVAGTHNLFVKAVTIANEAPSIVFNDVVGGVAALKSLTASTGAQDAATGALYSAIDTTPANLVGTVTIKENVSTTGDQTYTAKGFTLGDGTANQTLSLTTQTGNIAFNAGISSGSGFTPAGSGLIVSIFNSGGTVSGLSGSGLNYSVTDTTASASSSSTTSMSNLTFAQYSSGGALQNSFNNEFTQLASEIMYDQSGGSVTVGSPSEACVMRYEASYLSCVQ